MKKIWKSRPVIQATRKKYVTATIDQCKRQKTRQYKRKSEENYKYDREKDLMPFIGLFPDEIYDQTPEAIAKLIQKIKLALEKERRKARSNHWSYSLNKHIALKRALKFEKDRMRKRTSSC